MSRVHPSCVRLGAFVGALALTMLTVAVPIAVALDSTEAVDDKAVTAGVPQAEPTPVPDPATVVEEVVDEAENTAEEVVSTVKKTVDPSDPEPEASPSPDTGDPDDSDGSEPPTGRDKRNGDKASEGPIVVVISGSVSGGVGESRRTGLVPTPVTRRDRPADLGPRFDGLPEEFWITAQYPYQPAASVGGPRSTVDIMALLGPASVSPEQTAQILAPFPVSGSAGYSDDFGAPRDGGERRHQGTDIFAEHGTPVIASSDGQVSHMSVGTPLGGTSLRLTAPDGTYYYYAHLADFAPGMADGESVTKGELLGYVGNTGNAAFTPPHLHYEIHPDGGAAVDPVPILDGWLADALRNARGLILSPLAPVVAPALPPTVQTGMAEADAQTSPALPEILSSEPVQGGAGVGVIVLIGIAVLLVVLHAAPAVTAPYRAS